MNIGIIIHSHTGNTLMVAEKIMEKLVEKGHTVNVQRVKAVNENPNSRQPIVLEEMPSIEEYDCVIIGAPVWAFSLSPIMKMYLTELKSAQKIKACFVTQQLPKKWMGGNRSIRQIKKLCAQKGGELKASLIINWSSKNRDQLIEQTVNAACEIV